MTARKPKAESNLMQLCTARAKTTGKPCGNPPMNGGTVCRMHGGRAPQVKAKAKQRQAVAEAQKIISRLGGQVEQEPLEALLQLVGEAAANVHGYRSVIAGLEIEVGADGSVAIPERDLYSKNGITNVPARVHILVKMYDEERDRLARYSKLCLDAGVEERRVKLAEVQGRGLAEVVRAAVDACSPTEEERQKALTAAGEVMRRLGAA